MSDHTLRAQLENWNPNTHHTPLGSDELYRLAERIMSRLEAAERLVLAWHRLASEAAAYQPAEWLIRYRRLAVGEEPK